MAKVNCWELKKCGREPKGENVNELGVCPAAIFAGRDGDNGGKNAGRICWAVVGTLCEGKVQGTFAKKLVNCLDCELYRLVRKEEGKKFEIY